MTENKHCRFCKTTSLQFHLARDHKHFVNDTIVIQWGKRTVRRVRNACRPGNFRAVDAGAAAQERECEHEMERLAREDRGATAARVAQARDLGGLRHARGVGESRARAHGRPPLRRSCLSGALEEKDRDERINGQIVGIPISVKCELIDNNNDRCGAVTSGGGLRVEPSASPPRTLNLSTKLRTLPIQITPSTSQVVRTTYGAHNTLTLTALAPADVDVPALPPHPSTRFLHPTS
ncbi:hypothetical protein EVAR_11613_1 [Eumeta japonica]|uniref:Uncharacterized protein n=1 Tax=Eumeta variegata TaxID=151549 RepID=A0A4C1WW48_EUMVA|nr:hypothetical protein EVAR_11613_1 [Eumeta japonica]